MNCHSFSLSQPQLRERKREYNYLANALNNTNSDEDVNAKPGYWRCDNCQQSGGCNPETKDSFAANSRGQPATEELSANVAVEEGTQHQTLHPRIPLEFLFLKKKKK